ncbi:MAG: hypothetical protein QF707_02890, partial [Candidatus Poseidoniaceae archaeon]|nr:hypothetical protein [Candidatus Poseidoniaceae archaeon]
MTMYWNEMFFLALPYITLLLFFIVPIWRAFSGQWAWSARGDYGWTPRPSGFFVPETILKPPKEKKWVLII